MMPEMKAVALALGADASEIPEIKSCNECSSDNCNTASRQSAGTWIALLASIVTLIVVFRT